MRAKSLIRKLSENISWTVSSKHNVILICLIDDPNVCFRYYYAVIECDSVATAKALYEACDGTEYESSANFFDLRYIPDDMTFDDEPREVATIAPENYKPSIFSTQVRTSVSDTQSLYINEQNFMLGIATYQSETYLGRGWQWTHADYST